MGHANVTRHIIGDCKMPRLIDLVQCNNAEYPCKRERAHTISAQNDLFCFICAGCIGSKDTAYFYRSPQPYPNACIILHTHNTSFSAPGYPSKVCNHTLKRTMHTSGTAPKTTPSTHDPRRLIQVPLLMPHDTYNKRLPIKHKACQHSLGKLTTRR